MSDSNTASDYSKEAMYRSDPVNNGAPALLDQVSRLEQKMKSINQSAEQAAVLTKQAFQNGEPVLYASSCEGFESHNFLHCKLKAFYVCRHSVLYSINIIF